jgi:hypothetical protein
MYLQHDNAVREQSIGCTMTPHASPSPHASLMHGPGLGARRCLTCGVQDVTPYECERAVTAVCKVRFNS